jgi:hypothetical protein
MKISVKLKHQVWIKFEKNCQTSSTTNIRKENPKLDKN